jgi:hypothetical protein
MLKTSAKKLANALQKNRANTRPNYTQNPERRLGTVSAVAAGGKVSVILDGEDTAASYACAGNYYPIVGDRVGLQKWGNTWVVMTSISVTLRPRIQSGTNAFAVTVAATSASLNVNFPVAFDASPVVHVGFQGAPGGSSGWIIRAINVSATGFQAFATGTSSTYSTVIQWTAVKNGAL